MDLIQNTSADYAGQLCIIMYDYVLYVYVCMHFVCLFIALKVKKKISLFYEKA